MSDPIRKVSDVSPDISPDVSDVILRGMEVSQDKRYGSAREMQKALRKAYTAMQEAMSAHTVAFSSQEAFSGVSAMTPGPSASLGGSEGVASYGSEMPTRPVTSSSGRPPSTSGGFVGSDSGPVQDLDATVRYQGEIDSQVRQADVKTEVYRAEESPLVSPAFETPRVEAPYNSNPTPPVEDFRPTENIPGAQAFSPDATVPIISLNETAGAVAGSNQTANQEFFTTPNVANAADSYATVTQSETAAQRQVTSQGFQPATQAVKVAPAAKKKSSSKLIFALGALGLLFVLGLAGAGAGWYVYANYYAPQPTPTPLRNIEVTPSPESSSEVLSNSNDNTSGPVGTNTNSDTNSLTVEPTPIPTPTPASLNTPVQTRPTPQVQVKETPVVVKPPRTPRPTPKPNPTKPGIVQ
jgi:hypothetical protein